MGSLPKISEAEWEIMNLIWKNKRITSNEIIEKLKARKEWKGTTVKTLINRLLKKEAISFDKNGKEYFYFATIEKEECIKEESETFINRFFNGSINSMLLNFVKSEKLSNEEINELQEILNKSSEEGKS